MKKSSKTTYVTPEVSVDSLILETSLLTSVNVPGSTAKDAEEEEWTVS